MRIPAFAIALLLFFCASVSLHAEPIEGTYSGTVAGKNLVLELRAGGVAIVAGESGRWASREKAIEVSDGDGNIYGGRIVIGAIDFVVQGRTIRFTRQQEQTLLPRYKAKKVLAGKRVAVEGTALSFTLPKGWKGSWRNEEGVEAFVIQSPKLGLEILASARSLVASDAKKSIRTLVASWNAGLGEAREIEAPKDVSVSGRASAIVVSTFGSGAAAKRRLVAATRVDDSALVFYAQYPAAQEAILRPAFDTIFTSLTGTLPSAKPSTSGQGTAYTHCWRSLSSTGSGGGSTTRVTFFANNSYEWRASSSFGAAGGSVTTEVGTWTMVDAGRMRLTPNDGSEIVTWSVGMRGSAMILNGTKYYRCE